VPQIPARNFVRLDGRPLEEALNGKKRKEGRGGKGGG
jgi:hypothetical protein